MNDGLLAIHERRQVAEMAEQLKPFVPEDGQTVAIVNCDWKYPPAFPSDGELTAQLTFNWPDAQRRHFWAFAGLEAIKQDTVRRDGRLTTILDDPFGPHPELLRDWESLKSVFVRINPPKSESGGLTDVTSDHKRRRPKKPEAVTNLLWVTEVQLMSPIDKMHIGVQQIQVAKAAVTADNLQGK